MLIANRRDAGYTIVSRLEEGLRNHIEKKILANSSSFKDNIPEGILIKCQERCNLENCDSMEVT